MAADSLFGPVAGYEALPDSTKDAIGSFLHDTQDGDVDINEVTGGTVVSGLGANNEVQSVIIADDSGDPIAVTSGGFSATIEVASPLTVITVEGPDGEQGSSDDYFRGVVDSVVGSTAPGAAELNDSLNQAIDIVANEGTIVKIIQIIGDGETTITGNDSGDEVVALNLNKATGGVVVEGLDKVIVVGSGEVTIVGDTDTVIAGDLRDQNITGGDGNDTIVGGAGDDTITGGAGDDTFGFVGGAGTHTVITDFGAGDAFLIDMDGVSDVASLREAVVTVDTSGGDFTATFADGSSITLVGVSPDEITADLFTFNA
jgi:Ca2+-binding RTX toxin-like protein